MKTKEEIKEFLSQCDYQDVYSTIMSDEAKDANNNLMCIPQSYIGNREGHHKYYGFKTMRKMIRTCRENHVYDMVDRIFEFMSFNK